jgi:vacuolar-type H+-ATPase subunit H
MGVPVEFERLIEAEERNDALLREAVEQAAAIRREAERQAIDREASFAERLTEATREADEALATRRAAELFAITEHARAARARYAAVSEADLHRAVAGMIEALVHGEDDR